MFYNDRCDVHHAIFACKGSSTSPGAITNSRKKLDLEAFHVPFLFLTCILHLSTLLHSIFFCQARMFNGCSSQSTWMCGDVIGTPRPPFWQDMLAPGDRRDGRCSCVVFQQPMQMYENVNQVNPTLEFGKRKNLKTETGKILSGLGAQPWQQPWPRVSKAQFMILRSNWPWLFQADHAPCGIMFLLSPVGLQPLGSRRS